MTQSSIEWLMEIDKSRAITIEEWQQAKAMYKEEVVNAWLDDRYPLDKEWAKSCAESYYEETFNTKEK